MVAVEVIVNSLDCDVWSIQLDVKFDADKLNYVRFNDNNNKFVMNITEPDNVNGNVVKVATFQPAQDQTDAGERQMANIDGEVVLAVLYFEVDCFIPNGGVTSVDANFSIENISALDLDDDANNNPKQYVENDSITIKKFMDINGDGKVNDEDLREAFELYIEGKNGVDYDVTLDLNKDGLLTISDLRALSDYIVGNLTYDQVCALAADIDA
jgi:hypothetical protein